ncbi:aa3-type cytochrome c oxidase subunit IV [Azospirillum sp. sgz302134]
MDHGLEQGHNPVSDELVREHAAGWHAFTRFLTFGTAGVVVLLILMAIFLL